ncbi:MAG: DUF58 domain-containing protein [Candidatus Melainabacteria bacterium]|nr:DUF58 domain-containing protein [Candidatus Melainabacteria bacterium]
MRVNLNPYLTSSGKCKITREEAVLAAADFKRQLRSQPQEVVSHVLLQESIKSLRAIIRAYERGEIVCEPAVSEKNSNGTLPAALAEEIKTQTEEITYPDKKQTPKLPDLSNKAIVDISKMDFNALFRQKPFGKIEPPMPGALLKCANLRTPSPTGFISDLGYLDEYPVSPYISLAQANTSGKLFKIFYPEPPKIIPAPLGTEVVSVNSEVKIARPTEYDPVVWRTPLKRPNDLNYIIRQLDNDSPLLKADRKLFLPTEEEQKYWQAVLPLPETLRARIKESPDDLIHLIASYLGVKDKETGLTNFRYVCHPRFGDFILDNVDDLPLIMSELRVGHCDLLSWYVAAQMRAHGEVAWVGTDMITTNDGSAFNGAYKHSTVVLSKKDGRLAYFDPTIHCDFDKAYHPKIMQDILIDELEGKFQKAKTTKQKVKVLREFNRKVSELRIKAESSSEVLEDMKRLQIGALAGLFLTPPGFDDSNIKERGQIVSWNELPRVISPESLVLVFNEIWETELGEIRGVWKLDNVNKLVENYPRLLREQLAFVYRALNNMKLFIHNDEIIKTCLQGIQPDKELSSKDLYSLCSHSAIYNEPSCSFAFPVQNLIEHTSAKDLLDYFDYNPDTVNHLVGMYELWSLRKSDLRTSNFLRLKCSSNRKEFKSHSYTKLFTQALQKGVFFYSLDSEEGIKIDTYDIENNKETKINIKDHHLDKYLAIKKDIVVFAIECQYAYFDPKYREHLLNKLSIDEKMFKEISKFCLDFSENERRVRTKSLPNPLRGIVSKIDAASHIVYLTDECKEDFERTVLGTLRKIDFGPSSGKKIEFDEIRQYVPGDDARKLVWSQYGKDKFFVRLGQTYAQDISTPLYVFLDAQDCLDSTIYSLQIKELIRALQKDSREKGREVFIGINGYSGYFKLPQNIDPENIMACIYSSPASKTGLVLENGQLPKNLLFVSDSFSNTLAMKYLYGQKGHKLETIWLHDKAFQIFPLIKDSWMENGLPEQLRSKE